MKLVKSIFFFTQAPAEQSVCSSQVVASRTFSGQELLAELGPRNIVSDHSSLSTEDSWISLSSYQQHRETSFIPLNPKSAPKPISDRILESNVRLESALSNVVSPNSEYQCL